MQTVYKIYTVETAYGTQSLSPPWSRRMQIRRKNVKIHRSTLSRTYVHIYVTYDELKETAQTQTAIEVENPTCTRSLLHKRSEQLIGLLAKY